jgi:glycosyltransferase involved in cell wall biosynthesis
LNDNNLGKTIPTLDVETIIFSVKDLENIIFNKMVEQKFKTEKQPLISIIIPTYNYGHLISETIDSILAQTYENIEIIVIDDESTDNTTELIRNNYWIDIYPFFVNYYYIKHQGAKTPAHAMNYGISIAKGEYIAFLGADDRLAPEYIEKCYNQYIIADIKNINLGLVWTGLHYFGNFNKIQLPIISQTKWRYDFLLNPSGQLGAMLVPKSVYDKVGKFDEKIIGLEDWDMAIRILLSGYKAMSIKKPIAYARVHKGNSNHPEIQKNALKQLKKKYPLMHIAHLIYSMKLIIKSDMSFKEKFRVTKLTFEFLFSQL